jgi:hypothetical protein
VTVTVDGLNLSGQAEVSIAGNVRAAAGIVAEQRGVPLQDNLVVGGPASPGDRVDDLLDAVANRFGSRVAGGEVQLTDDGVFVATVPSTAPSPAERELGFAIADFASGGEGVINELPLADEVYLALGPEIQAVRTPLELSVRQGWTINAAEFNGYSGPFNLLENVPAPSEVVIGPNPRCASAFAAPAPPALAGHRRVVVLPAPDSIGSCLQWSAITLYLGDDNVIEGVGLDLVAP